MWEEAVISGSQSAWLQREKGHANKVSQPSFSPVILELNDFHI